MNKKLFLSLPLALLLTGCNILKPSSGSKEQSSSNNPSSGDTSSNSSETSSSSSSQGGGSANTRTFDFKATSFTV